MGRWKKRMTFIIAVIFAGAAAAAAWSVLEYTAWPELSIGGCQISEEEYLNCMESVEYDTKIQIQQKFNADYDEDFWTKKYEGSYGYEILAENTVERLNIFMQYMISRKRTAMWMMAATDRLRVGGRMKTPGAAKRAGEEKPSTD